MSGKPSRRNTKKLREETARANAVKNLRAAPDAAQWPPPAYNAPQYSPLCVPSKKTSGATGGQKAGANNAVSSGSQVEPENGAPVDYAAVADDSIDEGTGTGSILDSKQLFLIQMPPLPHPSAIYTDGSAENGKNAKNANGISKYESDLGGQASTLKDELTFDQSGTSTDQAQFVGKGATRVIATREQFLDRLPSGKLGKLRRYKSGKVELVLGNYVFDVTKGPALNTRRDIVHMNIDAKQYEPVGSAGERLIISPNINSLLDQEGRCREDSNAAKAEERK